MCRRVCWDRVWVRVCVRVAVVVRRRRRNGEVSGWVLLLSGVEKVRVLASGMVVSSVGQLVV